jgi:hypothetical protein
MIELSEYVPINLICVAALAALGLRRLVRMEKYHRPRVVLLTGLLWVPTIYLFLLCWPAPFPPYRHSCMTSSEEPPVFRISEY